MNRAAEHDPRDTCNEWRSGYICTRYLNTDEWIHHDSDRVTIRPNDSAKQVAWSLAPEYNRKRTDVKLYIPYF